MANLANTGLLLHQPLLPARPLQHRSITSASFHSRIRHSQPRKLCRKPDGAFVKIGRRDLQCKAQVQDNGVSRKNVHNTGLEKSKVQPVLASMSSPGAETATVGTRPPVPPPPPQPTYIGSPLLWIGVGVGISAVFSWVANSVKKYAMQQVFKTMMGQAAPGIGQPGSMPTSAGFGFPVPPFPASPQTPPSSTQTVSTPQTATSSTQTVDVFATEVTTQSREVNGAAETKAEAKKPAFVDVNPDEVLAQNSYAGKEQVSVETDASEEPTVSQGQTFKQEAGEAPNRYSQSTGKAGPILTVEALEKMMEDPTVQKMVYPYLPQEMQNPATFKWMMQNPEYRQQLEEMLNNVSGDASWDNQMMESLKSFDLNSQEVKQQFEQIGLTPEEVISKIMANPEVAMAFQNPKVQAAIMDCSQNPLSITKYQNDKEIMDVFNKISELFPGMTGSP